MARTKKIARRSTQGIPPRKVSAAESAQQTREDVVSKAVETPSTSQPAMAEKKPRVESSWGASGKAHTLLSVEEAPSQREMRDALRAKGVKSTYRSTEEYLSACAVASIRFVLSAEGLAKRKAKAAAEAAEAKALETERKRLEREADKCRAMAAKLERQADALATKAAETKKRPRAATEGGAGSSGGPG
eukprot:CAMPEP_0118935536 /NCGR_PEP_ID=MMETSP1169-20130426/15696_1 /TAXON_ID=36882 /ORGANISM="Pyramimonas obovata, Strain CCMP722" /LENGTH=188 /DNA_ID=CAMNT_0006878585 /DNA_START=87 /DNA_END=650 /DNA_ORIENTATION=+